MTTPAKTKIEPEQWTHLVPPIFARCVDPEAVRFAFSSPFLKLGRLYATDGRIAVRMEWPGTWDFESEGKKPALDNVFADFPPSQTEPITPPEVTDPCKACKGTIRVESRKCPECEGRGENDHECDCEFCEEQTDCEECEGQGTLGPGPCTECDGTGIDRPGDSIKIAEGVWIGRRYAALLSASKASVYPAERDPGKSPIRFTIHPEKKLLPDLAEAIEGVLMPMLGPYNSDD